MGVAGVPAERGGLSELPDRDLEEICRNPE
jgi:hypothetical protein